MERIFWERSSFPPPQRTLQELTFWSTVSAAEWTGLQNTHILWPPQESWNWQGAAGKVSLLVTTASVSRRRSVATRWENAEINRTRKGAGWLVLKTTTTRTSLPLYYLSVQNHSYQCLKLESDQWLLSILVSISNQFFVSILFICQKLCTTVTPSTWFCTCKIFQITFFSFWLILTWGIWSQHNWAALDTFVLPSQKSD